jgi:hypothetical protein
VFSILADAIAHIAITAALLQGFPHTTMPATDEHGNTAQYSGVPLRDILAKQGVPAGDAVRGKVMTEVVVVSAADGYRVVFTLPELDASFTDRVVLLADARDGAPFSAHDGPFRLIVPGEKRNARWIRQVTSVDVEDIP